MTLLIIVIVLALLFDYINGFHDAANSIATVVSTKVLSPFQAVLWAALFNFAAFFLFEDHAVANTVGKTVTQNFITLPVILSGLLAAIFWNLLTWWYGIPSSSSHTLIGGFAGAALTHAFMVKGQLGGVVEMDKIVKTILFIFLAPLIGMVISAFITLVTIKRNTWAKIGIILLVSVGTWFLFSHFRDNKFEETLTKFYKKDKYEKEIKSITHELQAKPGNVKLTKKLEENKEKYEKASKNVETSIATIDEFYNFSGPQTTVDSIAKRVSLKSLEIDKYRDEVSKVTFLDKVKQDAFYGKVSADSLNRLDSLVQSTKAIFKKYDPKKSDSAIKVVVAMFSLGENQTKKLTKGINKVNITETLRKEILKADNRPVVYGLLVIILIFILSFIYVEKIKKPNANRTANMFKKLQLLSSAAFSIGHGGNDAQKVMGIIAAAFVAQGSYSDLGTALKELTWVPLACYAAIGLGTLSGGWKIVKTMGTRITKVTPLEGVCAETSGAITLFMTEQMGIPVSTTHTITGSIIGVGATKRLSAVRWGVTQNLLIAWILTIPVSAVIAGLVYIITYFCGLK